MRAAALQPRRNRRKQTAIRRRPSRFCPTRSSRGAMSARHLYSERSFHLVLRCCCFDYGQGRVYTDFRNWAIWQPRCALELCQGCAHERAGSRTKHSLEPPPTTSCSRHRAGKFYRIPPEPPEFNAHRRLLRALACWRDRQHVAGIKPTDQAFDERV